MNTKQKTKNNFSGRMTNRGIFFSFIILFFFAFIGCKEPLTPGSDIPSGKGAFSLTLSNARTVLPNTPSLSDFAIYNLSFTPVSGGTALSADRTNSTLATSPILLDPGTYNLVVSAYKNTAKTQLMAQGMLNGIVITAGKSTPAAVTLEALLSGGTGTFSYSITLSNVTTTTRTMTIQANGTSAQTVTLDSGTTSGSRTLNSGSYNLTFNLTRSDGKRVVWRELLYVYQNLESNFTFTFTDAHFSDSNYTVTFDSNFADQGITPRSVSHGSKVTSSTPTNNFMTFSGWYTDNGTFANLYDFDTIVMESFTLYAKWDNVVPFESVTGLANKLSWLKTRAQSNGSYVLEVTADESIAPHTLSYSNRSNITVTLIGVGANRTVSLSSNGAMFTVDSGITLILGNNITLQGRSSNNNSLVRINSGGTLTMNAGSTITGNNFVKNSSNSNSNAAYGGGVYVDSNGTFTMTGGKISGNSASDNSNSSYSGNGGGVYINGGAFTMSGGEISGNGASLSHSANVVAGTGGNGGGVYMDSGTFTMSGGEISNNTVSYSYGNTTSTPSVGGNGGGVYMNSGTFTMSDGEISNNKTSSRNISTFAGGNGGGVYKGGGTFTMTGGKISENRINSIGSGGGVYGSFAMNGGEISSNSACFGGGVYGTFTMNSGKISNNNINRYNSYGGSGGGVYGSLTMNGGEISGNTANGGNGGGVYGSGSLTMNGGEISGNTADCGGGVHVIQTFTMNNGKISGNTANDDGGGVHVGWGGSSFAIFTMNGGEISGNSAVIGGGVMVYYQSSGTGRGEGTFRIVTGTVYGNDAAEGLRNTAYSAYYGAALYRYGAVAQRGTFNGSTWVSAGDLTATNISNINDTIRVVNGELVQ